MLQLIHSNVAGRVAPTSKGGSKYIVTLLDYYFRYCTVCVYCTIRKNSDVLSKFTEFKTRVENLHNTKIATIRADNGDEYLSNEFKLFLKDHDIGHQLTIPGTPQQNGVAERFNQTLFDTARCMLIQSGLKLDFGADAIMTACYIRNRCPTVNTHGNKDGCGNSTLISRNISRSQLPGPRYIETLKRYLDTRKPPEQIFKVALNVAAKYNNLVKVWAGPYLLVGLFNPQDVELILGSHVHLEKSAEYKYFQPWFGNGLLISYGDIWKNHRKMIAPTFHMNILKSFFPQFNEISRKVCKKMEREKGKPFDCHEYMSGVTVDILLETVMGYKEPRSEDSGFEYALAVMKMCNILHQRSYKPWLRFDSIFKKTQFSKDHDKLLSIIHDLTNKAVDSRKKDHLQKKSEIYEPKTTPTQEEKPKEEKPKVELAKETIQGYNNGTAVRDDLDENDENDVGEKKRLAFLDALTEAALQEGVNFTEQEVRDQVSTIMFEAFLDALTEAALQEGVNFTEQEVRDQVSTIMFEGHDTTAAGSSFVLCMLGVHQDIQTKVIQELDDIFHKTDRPVTYQDTLEMKLLERVIMETLRMYPPVPIIARKLNEDVKLASCDYTVPATTTVVIAPFVLHRSPKNFPNPDVFNPDNFLPEKCQERHFYSYIPFSAGPRSCVGRKYAMLKLKVLLATILRRFKVKSTVEEKDFVLQGDIILKRTDGFMIQLEDRQKIC
ncbi:Cytochrome P450 [Popillia japonica]|uniref:Cytochrome P450 n=1 Tax=Popillia japonica TaxID=7064 RepID=A0AAW1IZ41_POPJA